MSDADLTWMRRALELAERGRGHVEPNPLVGAVVVRDGVAVGEGWHRRYGEAHAEVNALAEAGAAARGATLYVTLEPCCHHGKTPPCTDAVLRAGINRVVVALEDPFPQVAGKGTAQLRAAGVAVDSSALEAEARRQNAPYLKLLTTGRPYVHAKWAMTLDGKIASCTGDSKWISNEASRRRVHELRGRMDAIIVGIGTALADDPLLTARPPGPRTATRVVLDSRGRLPASSQLAQTAREIPTLIVTTGPRPEELIRQGCEILTLGGSGILANSATRVGIGIAAVLDELGRRRMTNVLVEGGSEVLGSFVDSGAVDEVHVFLGAQLLGGAEARTAVGGRGAAKLAEAIKFSRQQIEELDGDVYVRAWLEG